MNIKQRITVSLLSVLMLSGVGAGTVNASAKSNMSQEQLIKKLETKPSVERAKHIKRVKIAKPTKSKRVTAKNAKQAKRQTRRQKKSNKFVKKVKRQARKRTRKARKGKRVVRRVRKSRFAKNRRTRKPRQIRRSHRATKNIARKPVRKTNWFNDGLNSQNLTARNWVTAHESGHEWNVLSYGGVCVGYFQLSPGYLGYKNGHVNLDHKHQVKVADAYAHNRYGSWVNAMHFWQAHHWY